ncbi:PRC and DUF2382 domain-containing protein [Streptomyces buecherae]|uniref:PRC and DUF2382 domain-containing protein n=1 Tax=Streptomyces buecherae TaxID=2763006 RepID=A0A7H8NHD0_9ACTN|nr:PRC and DUF2382 domain-containing protein [Streptomyces buecherae]QKW53870.1 PRC and DUF2382 domain-containing protein [Streptomyces buecherae]
MTAPQGDTPQELSGMHVVDPDGQKVGSVQQVYSDDITGVPEWITVRTGLFGMKETFVPLAGAQHSGGDLRVPYSKEEIKDAPRIDAAGHLSPEEETELYRHYGLRQPGRQTMGRGQGTDATAGGDANTTRGGMAGAAGGAAGGGAAGYAAGRESGQRTEAGGPKLVGAGAGRGAEAGDASVKETREMAAERTTKQGRGKHADRAAKEGVQEMILSEEQLRVGTEEHETGRARLRKHVVTEDVTRTVPVSHEEVHLTREPITADDMRRQSRDARIGDGEVEVTLHAERAVVRKETVPVERVRLETERVTEQEEVSAQVRKERVEYEGAEGDEGAAGERGRRGGAGGRKGPEDVR